MFVSSRDPRTSSSTVLSKFSTRPGITSPAAPGSPVPVSESGGHRGGCRAQSRYAENGVANPYLQTPTPAASRSETAGGAFSPPKAPLRSGLTSEDGVRLLENQMAARLNTKLPPIGGGGGTPTIAVSTASAGLVTSNKADSISPEQRVQMFPPAVVQHNQGQLEAVARDWPKAQKMAFAQALVADDSIPASRRHEMLQTLTGTAGADGKNAVKLQEVLDGAKAMSLSGLSEMLRDPAVGDKLAKQIGKTSPEAQAKMAAYVMGTSSLSSSTPVKDADKVLGKLMNGASATGLESIVQQAGTESSRDVLGKAVANSMHEDSRKRLGSSLSQQSLQTVSRALVDDDSRLPAARGGMLAQVLQGMKPEQRNAVFNDLETSPGRWGQFLEMMQHPANVARLLPGLSEANLAALNHGFEWKAASLKDALETTPPAQRDPADVTAMKDYRTAADQIDREVADRRERDPSFGKKYEKARDAYRNPRD